MSSEKALPQLGRTTLIGKVSKVRKIPREGKAPLYETTLMEAAKSEFDFPKQYPVMSDYVIGEEEQIIEVQCDIQSRRTNGYLNISLWPVQ